jgi:sec-independent protein translocase protein TatA
MDGLFANPLHWVILLVVVLIIFGPGKLPGVGSALGKSLREFKRATTEDETSPSVTNRQPAYSAAAAPSESASSTTRKCAMCSHENSPDARFCASCGTTLPEPALETTATTVQPVSQAMACADCGTENPPASRFCAHCGKMLEGSMQRV